MFLTFIKLSSYFRIKKIFGHCHEKFFNLDINVEPFGKIQYKFVIKRTFSKFAIQ